MSTLTAETERLLAERGIEPEVAIRHGIRSSDRLGCDSIEWDIIVGGKVVGRKFRTLGNRKQFLQDAGSKQVFWNFDCLLDLTLKGEPLVITEGELDALAAIQAGFVRTVSVPGGAPEKELGDDDTGGKYKFLAEAMEAMSGVNEVILCTDSDLPGIALMNDLALRIGKPRCKWVKYPKGCKDLGDALRLFGVRGVSETIRRAQWIEVPGIYAMESLPPVVPQQAFDAGLPWKIRLGDFCVITGVPSAGKSTVINEIAGRMADRHGWRTAFASFEMQPQTDHRRALRTWKAGKYVAAQTLEETKAADEWIEDRFRFLLPSDTEDATLAWVLERMAAAVIQHGCKLIVIDPFNEVEHIREGSETLTEYIGKAIRELKRFARRYQVHVIVAAHPRKMQRDKNGEWPIPSLYDISDSAHWANKPDVGVVIFQSGKDETVFRLAKSRYRDIIGKPDDYTFRFSSNDYHFTHLPKINEYGEVIG